VNARTRQPARDLPQLQLTQCDQGVIAALAKNSVRFLVIGARAAQFYGLSRETDDLDLLVDVAGETRGFLSALRDLRCGISGYPEKVLGDQKQRIRIGHLEYNVDILTSVEGLDFERAYAESATATVNGLTVRVLSLDDLIRSKLKMGRPMDLEDARILRELRPGGVSKET
jgi:hypothetical protein